MEVQFHRCNHFFYCTKHFTFFYKKTCTDQAQVYNVLENANSFYKRCLIRLAGRR